MAGGTRRSRYRASESGRGRGALWEELDAYGDRVETVRALSGHDFRVSSRAFWDMAEWASGMEISVTVHARTGVRRVLG
jgi:hypothetical protein